MRIWAILLDSRPAYLAGSDTSLLLLNLATGTLAEQLATWAKPLTRKAPLVFPPAGGERPSDYAERIAAVCANAQVVDGPGACMDALAGCEPSDVLLLLDAACLPTDAADLEPLLRRYAAEPRIAHHLIAFETGVAGTKERVNFDAAGRVRGIARHYEPTTWPFISGVFATLLPVASGLISDGGMPESLMELRRLLVARGVPSHDIPLKTIAFDCTEEKGVLAATEQFVMRAAAARAEAPADGTPEGSGRILLGDGHEIAPTARIVGPVIIHPRARIGEHATILGPASIGADAIVGERALVAHAAVADGAAVAAGTVVRDRIWVRDEGEVALRARAGTVVSYRDCLSRFVLETPAKPTPKVSEIARRHLYAKRLLDIVSSGLALLLLSPFFAIAALMVWLDSKGPIFYGDTREGRHGRGFKCWKFRTMAVNAHAVQTDLKGLARIDGPHFKLDRDPRVTRAGRILRATNLDELPQLFNVLAGQMSLVGPRPSPFRENQICVPWREARLSVPPGITGLWQVARHDRAAGDFHQWIEYDLLYVQHFTFWLDIKILVATLLTAGGKFGHVPAARLVRDSNATTAGENGGWDDAMDDEFTNRRIA
jgi:lipopolysaccharide/colanic/teichoic acid biosynthesis glycosyltransferase/carbonic anhydrase/acetyltransferase-like protein (isoleucine patch superfamily)